MKFPSKKLAREVAEGLKVAKAYIQNPRHWVQRYYSYRRNGAVRYCALGAARQFAPPEACELLREVAVDLYKTPIIAVNDIGTRTNAHPKVLAIYDAAITRAEAAGTPRKRKGTA